MKRIISLLIIAAIILGTCPTAFATNDYTAGTRIEYVGANVTSWVVTVPAKMTPGEESAVTAQGTWDSNSTLFVTADQEVVLTNNLNTNEQKVIDIMFEGLALNGSDVDSVSKTEPIRLSAITDALFGTWSGHFNYNVELTSNTTLPEIGKTAEQYTWDEIKAISNAGQAADYFKLGDTKTIVTNEGQEIVVEVVGINEDTNADGSGPVGISWASQITIEERQMHPTEDINSWVDSETRRWLQEDFYQELPEDLQSAIVSVNKTYYDNADKTTKTCVDSLWIPSYREIFGNPNNNPNFETEGPDYTEFFHSENARVRYALDGSDTYWWVRTAAFNRDVGYFYAVNKISYFGAATMTAGILLCFCT